MNPTRLLPFVLFVAPFLGGAGACDCGGGGTIPDAGAGKCTSDTECLSTNYCNGVGFCAPFNPDSDARGCLRALSEPCVGGTVCSNAARACVPVCGPRGADAGTCLTICARDQDCANQIYCDGVERCEPGNVRADARGCRPALPLNPFSVGQLCDEAAQQCLGVLVDADGDGFDSSVECDDSDAARFPGNTEVCDLTGHDEDCNPSTLGTRDVDQDGFIDHLCCNGTACERDCNDAVGAINPNQPELCNGRDDDCDGVIDEDVTVPLFTDADRDGFGAGAAAAGCLGTAGKSLLGNDCDDANPAVGPGALVCTPAVGPGNYNLCITAGTFEGGKCSLQMTCHPQPNGTGICF